MFTLRQALLIVAFATMSFGQTIGGMLVDQYGSRVSNVTLKVSNYSATSDSNGIWSFNLPTVIQAPAQSNRQIQFIGSVAVLNLANPSEVRAEIFNLLGKNLRTPFSGYLSAGTHSIQLGQIPDGVWIVRISASGHTESFCIQSFASHITANAVQGSAKTALAKEASASIDTLTLIQDSLVIGKFALDMLDTTNHTIVLSKIQPFLIPSNAGSILYQGPSYLLPGTTLSLRVNFDKALWNMGWFMVGSDSSSSSDTTISTQLSSVNDSIKVFMKSRLQNLSLPSIANKTYGDGDTVIEVSSSSGLTALLASVTPLICSAINNTVKILDVGSCTLKATQAGSDSYNPDSATTTFLVQPKPLTLAHKNGVTKVYDGTTSTTTLKQDTNYLLVGIVGTDTVNASITSALYNDANVAKASNVVFQYSNKLTGAQSYRYSFVAGKDSIAATITKAVPTVTWPTSSTEITYGQPLFAANIIGGIGLGTYSWQSKDSIPSAGIRNYSVTFTPTDSSNYFSLIGDLDLTIQKANQTVSFVGWYEYFLGRVNYFNPTSGGDEHSSATGGIYVISSAPLCQPTMINLEPCDDPYIAKASSGLPLKFSVAPAVNCSVKDSVVTMKQDGLCIIYAIQPGDSNYNPASTSWKDTSVSVELLDPDPDPGVLLLDPVANVDLLILRDTISVSIPDTKYKGSTITLSPSSLSGLPVTITSMSQSICSVANGNRIDLSSNNGTCSLRLTTPGGVSDGATWTADTLSGSIVVKEQIIQSFRIVLPTP